MSFALSSGERKPINYPVLSWNLVDYDLHAMLRLLRLLHDENGDLPRQFYPL